jgi:hypothetical protein
MWAIGLALVCAGGWIALRQTLAPPMVVAVVETEVVREQARGPLLSLTVEAPLSDALPAPCPVVDPAIDRPVGPLIDPNAAETVAAVALTGAIAAPTRAGLLAARDDHRVYLSTDDGRNLRPVLDRAGALQGIAFGCAGELFALRGDVGDLWLGVHGAGGDRWQRVRLGECDGDAVTELSLWAGAGWLAISRRGHCDDDAATALWLSPDRGRSWRRMTIPEQYMVEGVRVLDMRPERIRVVAYEGDCMYDGTVLYDLDPRTGAVIRARVASRRYQMWSVEARGRWAYSDRGCDAVLCRAELDGPPASDHDDGRRWSTLIPEPEPEPEPEPAGDDVASDCGTARGANREPTRARAHVAREPAHARAHVAREPFFIAGPRHLYSFDGQTLWSVASGGARRLPGVPAPAHYVALDPAGRLLGISEGRLVRWSFVHGTRLLAEPSPCEC